MNYKESMKNRILERKQHLLDRVEGCLKQIENDIVGGEAERVWLDSFAKGGKGLDLCAGDYVTKDCLGYDGDLRYLGCDFLMPLDELWMFNEGTFDFVVSNYIEAVTTPMKSFGEIYKMLKPGGAVAVSFRDADAYTDHLGVLGNTRRRSVFSRTTMKNYLARAGFLNVSITDGSDKYWARASGYKGKA